MNGNQLFTFPAQISATRGHKGFTVFIFPFLVIKDLQKIIHILTQGLV